MSKYQIWLSDCLFGVNKTMFKKPEVKETKELRENLREGRNDKIVIPEKQLDIF